MELRGEPDGVLLPEVVEQEWSREDAVRVLMTLTFRGSKRGREEPWRTSFDVKSLRQPMAKSTTMGNGLPKCLPLKYLARVSKSLVVFALMTAQRWTIVDFLVTCTLSTLSSKPADLRTDSSDPGTQSIFDKPRK